MATNTPNLNLVKPSTSDKMKDTVTALASNMDTLDSHIHNNDNQIGTLSNVKIYAAMPPYNVSQNGQDQYANLQKAITDAFNNNIGEVVLPTGASGQILTSKPLYLWGSTGYQTLGVKLSASKMVTIKKTTHNFTGDGSALDHIDAVAIITRYDKDVTKECYNVELDNIFLDGLVSGTTDYTAFALMSKAKCAKIIVNQCILRADICFQSQDSMWQSSFRNLMMYPNSKGFSMIASGTSNLLEDCYVYGSSVKAYELRGDYSFANNLAVDQATGICYDFYYANWTISGIGEESPAATTFINTQRAYLKLSSITSFGVSGTNAVVFNIGNESYVKVDGGMIGQLDTPLTVNGKFLEKGDTNSFFRYENLAVYNTYQQNTATDGYSSGIVYGSPFGTQIRYRGNGHSPHIGLDRGGNQYADMYNSTKKLTGKAIFMDSQGFPLTDSLGGDRQWDQKPAKGDVFLENDPATNGTFAWVVTNNPATYLRDATFAKVPIILSGTTAQRPTANLVVGQQYFDTTLNKPVWLKTLSPIAWVDATGASV